MAVTTQDIDAQAGEHREILESSETRYPHLRVVLCKYMGKYVTWVHNLSSGGFGNGHYFDKAIDAVHDFAERCRKENG